MSKIIIALDYQNADDALNLVKTVGSYGDYYKVGLELFISDGARVLSELKSMEKKIFLDLKLHDIPNTASKALKSCMKYDVDIVDIHVQGGVDMMRACSDAINSFSKKPLLIGVTLLTSLDDSHLNRYMIDSCSQDYVAHMALIARECGLDGVVASAKETSFIKKHVGTDFITVTPGIRLAGDSAGDQKRVLTPVDAARLGTDFMVIGRSITTAEDPRRVTAEILQSIESI